jgi:outer membrane immunogenic protein
MFHLHLQLYLFFKESVMKKCLLSGLVAMTMTMGAVGVANAVDWTGPYAGLSAGIAGHQSEWKNIYGTYEGGPTDIAPGILVNNNSAGVLAGVTAGYNFNSASPYVIGVEGNIAFGNPDVKSRCIGDQGYGASCASETNWIGDLAVRFGLPVERTLYFVKGGAAFGNFKYKVGDFVGFTAPPYGSKTKTKTGWLVGAGVEQAVSDKTSVKFEANYMDFGKDRMNFSSGTGPGPYAPEYSTDFGTDITEKMWVVKVGMNMKF